LASTNGFILGLIGGLLDLASASLLIVGQSGATSTVSGTASPYVWAAILTVLGVAVVATSVVSVMSVGIQYGRVFSLLMIVYGVSMMIIGAALTTGYIMAQDVSTIYSYGMVIVGAAILVNGILMSRNEVPL